MFNRKPNWRAGIVGLASLALLATFPLATVTASAEPVEPPPTPASTVEHATTVKTSESPAAKKVAVKDAVESLAKKAASSEGASVERAASGYDAFRMAGQDRSSEMDGLVSLKNRPNDGAWMVGQHGELRQIKTVSTDPLKRVMVTHDFPLGEFCWLSPNGHGSGEYVTNQNGYSARPWFKKPFGSFPGKFDGFAQNENYVYLTATKELDNDSNVNWGATVVRFDKTNNSWQYNARGSWRDISWRKSSYNNQEVSINQPPNFNPPQPSGVCIQPSTRLDFEANGRGNTFSRFAGNVTSGVLLKDGTYVFGGVAEKPKPAGGQFTARNKMFALKPGGQVVYLGYFDIAQSKAFSLDGNYVLSENGDIYASYGTVNNDGYMSGSYKVSIDKISANDIQNRINNPVAVYDTSVSQWRSNGQGKTIRSTNVMRERKFAARGRTQMFGAFDISPDGNFVIFGTEEAVDLHGSITQNETGTITEYDINTGRPIRNIESYRATESQKQSWLRGHGSKMPQVTDGSGALIPPPDRDFTLSKQVVNRIGDDQFKVDLNPLNPFSNIAKYTIPEQTTSFTQSKQTMQIREKISISGLSFKARIAERADGNAKLTNYNTTLECSENVKVGEVNNRSGNRYFDIEVPASVQSPIACKLVNKGPAPKRTFEFEKNLTRALSNDSFTVYMEPATSGIIQTRHTTVSGRDGVFNIPTFRGSKKQEISNGDIRVNFIEQATKGSLDNYKTSLSCVDNNGALTLSNRVPYVNGNTWQLAATIPNSAEGDIVCTLRNAGTAPQPKGKTVTLYKKFDRRYKNSDNFKVFAEVPLSYPINKAEGQTNNTIYPNASATTPLSSKVFKNNATITVGELGVGQTNLNNYDRDIKCTEGGFNGTPLPVAANVGNSKQFNLSSTTSSTVDCYVINKARKKVTIHKSFNRRFVDSDNFTVTATNMNKQDQSVSGTTTGTGTQNQGMNDFNPALFSNDAYLKVTETGVNRTDLSHYETSIKCTEGGLNGATIYPDSIATDRRTAYFNLANVRSTVVDCYVTNEVPEPERTITVKKIFKNDTTTEGFSISGYFGTYSNAFNKPDTSGHNINEAFDVTAAPKKISKGQDVLAVFNEGARPDRHIESYDISVVCKGEGADTDLDNITDDKTVKITGTTNGNSWEGRGTIPAKLTGSITCTLINEKPANTKVVLFKQLKTFNDNDQFSVGLEPQNPNNAEYGITQVAVPGQLTAETSNDGYKKYKIGTIAKRPKGQNFQFNITETATSGEFANYTPKVTCKAVSPDSSEADIQGLVNLPLTNTVTIPQTQKGEVHCYLRNEPKPKGSITIHKVSKTGGLDLAGSEWKICKKDASPAECFSVADNVKTGVVADGTPGKVADVDKRTAYIKIQGLSLGTYTITETKAPVGFLINTSIEDVSIAENSIDATKQVEDEQVTVPELPFTGGWGTLPYMILGFVLTGGAVVAFVIAKPKNTKPSHK